MLKLSICKYKLDEETIEKENTKICSTDMTKLFNNRPDDETCYKVMNKPLVMQIVNNEAGKGKLKFGVSSVMWSSCNKYLVGNII